MPWTKTGNIRGPQGPAGPGVPTPVVNGQWIKGVGGAAVWSAIATADLPSAYAIKRTSGSLVAPSGFTPVQMTATPINVGGFTTPDAYRIGFPVTGIYLVGQLATWAGGQSGGTSWESFIQLEGSMSSVGRACDHAMPAANWAPGVYTGQAEIVNATAGDTCFLYVYQDGGGNLNITRTYLYAAFLGHR
jgi:hypothetical protein